MCVIIHHRIFTGGVKFPPEKENFNFCPNLGDCLVVSQLDLKYKWALVHYIHWVFLLWTKFFFFSDNFGTNSETEKKDFHIFEDYFERESRPEF